MRANGGFYRLRVEYESLLFSFMVTIHLEPDLNVSVCTLCTIDAFAYSIITISHQCTLIMISVQTAPMMNCVKIYNIISNSLELLVGKHSKPRSDILNVCFGPPDILSM